MTGRPRKYRRYKEYWIYERTECIQDLDERVYWRIAELGITFTEVAHRCGVSQPTFSNWFIRRKTNVWDRSQITRLCRALEWDSTAPLHEPLPNLATHTRQMLAKWKRNIANSAQSGSEEMSIESAEKLNNDESTE